MAELPELIADNKPIWVLPSICHTATRDHGSIESQKSELCDMELPSTIGGYKFCCLEQSVWWAVMIGLLQSSRPQTLS